MSPKMVTIASFENTAEAHAAKNCLESEGIAAIVTDESVGSWLGYMGSAIGGIKLQVAQADLERAREVLSSEIAGDGAPAEPWRCLRCQEIVDAGFEICWSCGGEREEFRDPSFDPNESSNDGPVEASVNDDDVSNIAPPVGRDALIDGQPNPYYAGSLPAVSQAVGRDAVQAASEEAEAMAIRAWRAAILGVFICPMALLVNVYSVWLLVRVGLEPGELSPSGTWKCRMAWIINWIVILIMLTVLSFTFGAWNG